MILNLNQIGLASAFHIGLRNLLDRQAHSVVANLCKMLQEDQQNCSNTLMLNRTDHDDIDSGSVVVDTAGCLSHCNMAGTHDHGTVVDDHLVSQLQSFHAAAVLVVVAGNIVR